MNIAILSNGINIARIKLEIQSMYTGFNFRKTDICFVDFYDEQKQNDMVIVDYNFLDEFWLNSVAFFSKFLLFINGFIFDPYDKSGIEELEKALIDNKQWGILRTINKVKIHLNVLHRKLVLDTKPRYLQLEITNFCNAKCIMCPHVYLGNDGAKHLNKDTFLHLEEILPYIEVAVLHGNGEPFLNPNFEEYLDIYRKYGIAISACTNLSVFNAKIAKIVDTCFDDIRVSCDACTKDKYEKIRTGLSFERFMENLEILYAYCHNVKKIMTFVIMRQNINQIATMVEFAAKYGFEEIIYSNMSPSIALGNENDAPSHYKKAVKYQLDIAKEKAKARGIRVVYPNIYDTIIEDGSIFVDESFRSDSDWELQVGLIQKAFKGKKRPIEELSEHLWKDESVDCIGICDWLVEKTYIDIDGNVFLCCINSSYRIGNINEQSFLSIWNSKIIRDLREYFYTGHIPNFCHGCQFILNGSLNNLKCATPNEAFMKRKIYYEINEAKNG